MLRDRPPHYVGAGVVVVVAAVVAVLLNTSLTAAGRLGRLEAARAALRVADATVFLAAGGVAVGLGVGLVLGGLAAYHGEVTDR
jgi:hypothetical protein